MYSIEGAIFNLMWQNYRKHTQLLVLQAVIEGYKNINI